METVCLLSWQLKKSALAKYEALGSDYEPEKALGFDYKPKEEI